MVKSPVSYQVPPAPPLSLALSLQYRSTPSGSTPSPPTSGKLSTVEWPLSRGSCILYALSLPGPRGSPRPTWPPPPPKGGGISGVARDVATCAAEAVCVRGGPSGGRGGRGPTGSDITPVPLSPPTPLKNPKPVSLPPSRHPPLLLPVEADSTHNRHCTPFPRHVPFNPSFLLSTLTAQKLLPCAYPGSRQVGSRLRSRDRSIESLEYKERREASVEYKAAGAELALQLEKAPGRKPGESAR